MSSPTELRLAADFEPATREAWRRLALGVLVKAGTLDADAPDAIDHVEEALATRSYDGIAIEALYTADPDAPPSSRPGFRTGGAGWDVRQRHDDPDAKLANEAILTDLDNGVTSLWLTLGEGGLAVGDLRTALAGVLLDLAPVALDAGAQSTSAADTLLTIASEAGVAPEALRGSLGFDPVGLAIRTLTEVDLAPMTKYAAKLGTYPGLALATVDANVYHDAGGSDAQEIGFALATAVSYLRVLTESGLGLADALSRIELRVAATADQFLTIAKMRALRRTWARIAQASGADLDARGVRIHAVTSSAMMTARDPWVNMLRVTLACFGAGVGGADSVTVQPFDSELGLPDGFSRRIARNTHALLQLESHVSRVLDPAGGSWYVERLTDELAHSAWAVFTATETEGGIAAALATGSVLRQLDETWSARSTEIAHRRDPITGVSEFPNLGEKLPQRRPHAKRTNLGLPTRRYSEAFETLRSRADIHAASTGTRPTVFLATLGPLATYTGRATFAENLLAAGGIATLAAGPTLTDDVESLAANIAEAFTKSGAVVACVTSSDKVYSAAAATVAQSLTGAGARAVWLAGPQRDYGGVGGYLFAGCNAVAVLSDMLEQLGVA